MIDITCPDCDVELELGVDLQGEEIECPVCDAYFAVPFLLTPAKDSTNYGQLIAITVICTLLIGGVVFFLIGTQLELFDRSSRTPSKYPRTHPEMSAEREDYLRGLSERVLNNEMTPEDMENIRRSQGK